MCKILTPRMPCDGTYCVKKKALLSCVDARVFKIICVERKALLTVSTGNSLSSFLSLSLSFFLSFFLSF